ncbi:MAG: hypothetical protein GX638_10775, partial [Crenarchaeota archaeon]|nr:hypothetical protein [Thermoproteota archaeon]
MHSRLALTKLKTILLIDILIIAIAAGGYVYLQTIPLSPIDPTDIQLTELDITPAQTAVGQVVAIRFNVTNLGDSKGTYEANLFVDNVSEQTQTILLSAGETKAVTFTLTPTIEGMHSIKIGSLDGSFSVISKFTLSDLVMNRTQAGKGEPIGISVKITNKQAQTEEYTLTLTINGEIRETKTGQIEANSTESVLFEVIEQNEGTYQVSIGSLSGVFQIFPEAPEARPAEFELNNLLIDPQITEANSPVQISVNITNVGEASGTYEIKFYIDDVIEETETVQLLGGESKTVRITATRATIGSYSVKVDGLSGSFTIQKESTILLNNMFVKPYEVWPNQDTTVTVRTSNPGSETSSLSLRLVLDNEVVETKTITLAAGANQDVTFQVSSEIEGSHSIAVNTLTYGGFKVVKEGYHTLSISTSPATGVEFKLNGVKHQTFYSELLPVGERYTIEMPLTDPQGRYTFQKWDSGSTEPTVTV